MTGLFVEGGRGNYDSHNSFYNAASVHGDGDARYHGAGLLGRYTFTNGFYADASYRFGKNRTHFVFFNRTTPLKIRFILAFSIPVLG